MARSLPDLATLAPDAARLLGAEAAFALAGGEWPAAALAFSGQCLLLLRDHGFSVSLSLPVEHSWSLGDHAELLNAVPQITACLAAYRARHPHAVSLADVLVAIAPTLAHLEGSSWATSFPGTPVPSEVWLESDGRSVGLFQEQASVKVVVWVSGQMHAKELSTPRALPRLLPWLERQIAAQAAANVADALVAAEREARKMALPPVSVEEVLAAMRAGARFRAGAGRYHETFFLEGTQLRCEMFDEGHTETNDSTVSKLETAIHYHPDDFRRAR